MTRLRTAASTALLRWLLPFAATLLLLLLANVALLRLLPAAPLLLRLQREGVARR